MAHPKVPVNFSTPRKAASHGRFGDSLIAFLSPQAQAHLASKDNVLATINPLTGLPEYADISEEDDTSGVSALSAKGLEELNSNAEVLALSTTDAGADETYEGLDTLSLLGDYDVDALTIDTSGIEETVDETDDNADWVKSMYTQVFDRDADQAGSTYWTDQLNSGAVSQDDVMKTFLESNEYDEKQMEPDYNIDTIYDDVFGREADEAGSTYWNTQFDTTATNYDDIVSSMINSDEASNMYAAQEEVETGDTTNDFTTTIADGSVFTYDPVTRSPVMISGPTDGTGDGADDDAIDEALGLTTLSTIDTTGTDGDGADGADGTVVDGTSTSLAQSILDKAADVVDTTSSDTEETAETVVIASEDGGEEAINVVNEALLANANLSEIMSLLDRSNLRDMGVRYIRAIRDNQGNRIFYNMNADEFNQNRNQLRRLYWGNSWKAVDNAEDDSGYGSRAAATTNFLGGA